jgi:predicted NAD/FAD-binding protein
MPATPANVTLYFTRFALASPSDDAISIFDGPSSSSSRVLASFGYGRQTSAL